jgi:hypothetical protein
MTPNAKLTCPPRAGGKDAMNTTTDAGRDAVAGQVERPVRPAADARKLTDRQIADMAFAVLREHNDNRLWRALTYDSGPYDVTTPTLALCHLARVFFAAGVAAALAGCVDMVQPPDIAVAEELCAKRGGYAHAQRWERGTVLDINCKDGTQLQVRLPKKA